MTRAVLAAVCLLLLVATCGCGDAPKDQIPDKIQQPPREQPTDGSFDMKKK
jgi:hypothetical protein